MTTPAPHGYPDTGAPEHPTATAAFERLLLNVPATVLSPLQSARRELAQAEAELRHAYPEGASLAEENVERKRRDVMRLEAAILP